jgi:glutathione synthase/RimK-type ligase-like ATP-grasp enzyme
MMLRALGVYREHAFSPGKVEADAAILDAVLAILAGHGIESCAVDPAEFISSPNSRYDLIMAMCQGEPALQALAAAQAGGALVINAPMAIRSCYRDRLGRILNEAGLPVPAGTLVETSASLDSRPLHALRPEHGIYVKRGDLHALYPGDVCRVDDAAALAASLQAFAARGIRLAYLQQVVEGRVVKFYGVSGAGYFTTADGGAEISVALRARLRQAAEAAASALGLEVWGGDAIVGGEQFKIVDFNDWPSFERVRTDAASAIASRAVELLARGEE